MRSRGVTLLVAIYLALDFANPMMPGAVQLVAGSIASVDGCQARGIEIPGSAVTMAPEHLVADLPQPAPARLARRRVVSVCPLVPAHVRASLGPRSTLASSSDDD
jgi:hypothetical protein